MHSGVFAISPQAAAELTLAYAKGELKTRETEIVDVDEELYRPGELQTRLYATGQNALQTCAGPGEKEDLQQQQ